MLPTLRQLEYIVAVADTGQFSEAARACHVSQPALSKQIREVEELLGQALFERTRPRVTMTRTGEEIVPRARAILLGAHELVDAAVALSGTRRGTLRLGVIPTIAPYGLPGLLAKLRKVLPELSFVIKELPTDDLLDALRGGGVELALLAHSFDTSGLEGMDLVEEPFVLIAPRGHHLSTDAEVHPSEIGGESLILMQDGHCLRDQAIDVCAAAGAPPPTSVAAASVSTLVRMVESGLGPTLLPASALESELRGDGAVIARSFGDIAPGRTLTLQWRGTSPSGEFFRNLGDIMRAHYVTLNSSVPSIFGARPLIRVAE